MAREKRKIRHSCESSTSSYPLQHHESRLCNKQLKDLVRTHDKPTKEIVCMTFSKDYVSFSVFVSTMEFLSPNFHCLILAFLVAY